MQKNFLHRFFVIIGVKQGRDLSTREIGKAVKLEFWVTQEEQEDYHIITH
jgi:hypothetical protein